MNSIYKILFFFVLLLGIFGCDTDRDPEPVTEVASPIERLAATSTRTGVALAWENPTGRPYDKVEIWYQVNGEKVILSQQVTAQYQEVAIALPDDAVYKFHLQAYTAGQDRLGTEVSVKSRKITVTDPDQELADVLNSVQILGGDGGVRVYWSNPENIPATIQISYDQQQVQIPAHQLLKETSIQALDLEKTYNFAVSLLFNDELHTATKHFSVRPLAGYRRLTNEGWSIRASSEEISSNEQAPAINLLDNNPRTYWRSKVSAPEARYPHYVIIDMKRERRVTAITLSRKQGDSDYSSWDNNISLSKDGITYGEVFRYFGSNTHPNLIFKVEFNRTVEGEQMYMLPFVHTARYVRIDMVRASRVHAVFGDINIYGE